jgi:peptidyl-prolyl cis-trans isomerase C/peptidyl-prolyl cis-trans isomerase D
MKRAQSYVTLLGLMGGILAASASMAATEVARVNGKVISLEDLNKKYQQSLQYFQVKTPTKKGFLDDLIKRELGIEEAKKLGIDRDPEVIEAMNTVLFNAYVSKKLSKELESIHVSDSEAKDFYSKNPEIRTSHIFVAAPFNVNAEEDKKARARIQKIYDEHIRNGKENFSEVAQRFSEGPAAPMGGDIDYKMRGMVDPAYYEAAANLRTVGRVSGIVRSQSGYHIIKVTAVKSWDDVDHASIKRQLIEERQRETFDKLMNQLRTHAKVTVRNDLIKD